MQRGKRLNTAADIELRSSEDGSFTYAIAARVTPVVIFNKYVQVQDIAIYATNHLTETQKMALIDFINELAVTKETLIDFYNRSAIRGGYISCVRLTRNGLMDWT